MARLKARRSRYRFTHRLASSAPAVLVVAVLVVTIVGTSLVAGRVIGFLNHVTGGAPSVASIAQVVGITEDRKSTRLNSSHRCISYAVFCLEKKRKEKNF